MMLEFLDDQRMLERAVPLLAKQFRIQKGDVWKLLENQSTGLRELISMRRDSNLRRDVNKWWHQYRHKFPSMGMANFVRVEAKQLPDSTYDQAIVLMWLSNALRVKPMVRLIKMKAEVGVFKPLPSTPVPKLNLWQIVAAWFKKFFKRR